jgi:hypothetical protein
VVYHPSLSWRGPYWLLVAVNAIALVAWVLFYFPPTFENKHKDLGDASKRAFWIKHYDYVGTLLFAAGFIIFLLGLSWGGGAYPWASGRVIGFLVGGFFILVIFVLYEIYMPLKAPFVPMHLFKNQGWWVACVLLGIGAGVYYAFSVILPMQAAVLYADGDLLYIGWLGSLVGCGIISGQMTGGWLCNIIGKAKYQCMAMFLLGGLFLGCKSYLLMLIRLLTTREGAAVITADNKNVELALIFMGCFFIGWNETLCLANATIMLHDQQEIGVAGGVAGSIRGIVSAICLSVYTTVLSNRLTETISTRVPTALVNAGLPSSSVESFIAAISVGTPAAFKQVSGVNANIIAVGLRAYKVANADAYRTVYLSTIAFSAFGLILSFFGKSTDRLMSDSVAATLHGEGAQDADKTIDEEKASN